MPDELSLATVARRAVNTGIRSAANLARETAEGMESGRLRGLDGPAALRAFADTLEEAAAEKVKPGTEAKVRDGSMLISSESGTWVWSTKAGGWVRP